MKKRKQEDQTDTPFKKRSYDKKTKYNNNKKNRLPSMIVNRTPTFLPDVFVTKMKLSVTGSLSSTSGAITFASLKGNSMYDPMGGSGSQQPSGFDQLSTLYKKFCVTGSRAKVQVCPRGVVGTDVVLVPYRTAQSAFTTTDQASEQPRSKRAYGFLYDKLILDNYAATSTILGVPSEAIISDDGFSGSNTADPIDGFSWAIYYQPSDKSTTSTVDYIFEITYYCRFYERVLQLDA